jgi:hypothetical protein
LCTLTKVREDTKALCGHLHQPCAFVSIDASHTKNKKNKNKKEKKVKERKGGTI